VLWTNLHGGMLGGVATMGLAVAGWIVAKWIGWPTPIANYRQAAELIAIVVACGLTMFVTPYGAGVAKIWLTIMSAGLPQLVVEHMSLWTLWQDPGRSDMAFRAGSAMLALAAMHGFALLNCKERPPRVTWLLPLAWLVLGFSSIRHIPLFMVVAAVVLAELLPRTHMLADWDWFRPPPSEKNGRLTAWAVPALAFVVAFGVAIGWHVGGKSDPERAGFFVQVPAHAWPLDLLDDLRRRDSKTTRIFNEDMFGGFLIRYVPELPVFMDDRYEIYGDKNLYLRDGKTFLQEYTDALVTRPERLDEWTQHYDLNLALTQRFSPSDGVVQDSAFGKYLRSPKAQANGWRLVKEIDAAALFERRP
jgi:hypothetical protein